MKIRNGTLLLVIGLMMVSACSPASPVTAEEQTNWPDQANPQDSSFFMSVPFNPTGDQLLEIKPQEIAFLSIATVEAKLPLAHWTNLGWMMGANLSQSDPVPQDCLLHYRAGVTGQAYAACVGPITLSIPQEGGDFVYVVFTDTNNRIVRIMQTGVKYRPSTARLTP
jgi:hypothetical protein